MYYHRLRNESLNMFQLILLGRLKIKNHMYICYNLHIILGEWFSIKNYILLFKQNHMIILDLHDMLVIYAFSFANQCYQFTMCFVILVFLLLIFSLKYVAYLDSFEGWFIFLIVNNIIPCLLIYLFVWKIAFS